MVTKPPGRALVRSPDKLLLDLKSTSTSSMVHVPKQSAGGEIMSKQQERSQVGGAVLAVFFCMALALGLWWGARRMPARTPQNKVAETSANQAVSSETSFYCNTKSLSVLEWAHKGQISQKMKIARAERKRSNEEVKRQAVKLRSKKTRQTIGGDYGRRWFLLRH